MKADGTSKQTAQPARTDAALPVIRCRNLPEFTVDDFESVRLAFQDATPCALKQSWLKQEEADFAPAVVRTGWQQSSLLVFTELTDKDIFTHATGPNQRAWELGDVFEMFLRPDGQKCYVEFHVAPNNQRLQLRFADSGALERVRSTGSLEEVIIKDQAFHSMTWMRPELGKWFVYAAIPAASVCEQPKPLEGCQWRFSFSRYDYTRGRTEPVISSTSPHAEPSFHRQQEWGMIKFLN
jgi:hypothetical protein